jgi:hypothetical protein
VTRNQHLILIVGAFDGAFHSLALARRRSGAAA